jgi:hypothetical protein
LVTDKTATLNTEQILKLRAQVEALRSVLEQYSQGTPAQKESDDSDENTKPVRQLDLEDEDSDEDSSPKAPKGRPDKVRIATEEEIPETAAQGIQARQRKLAGPLYRSKLEDEDSALVGIAEGMKRRKRGR